MFFNASTHSEEIVSSTVLRDKNRQTTQQVRLRKLTDNLRVNFFFFFYHFIVFVITNLFHFINVPLTVYLLVWRPSLYRACVISAHARMAPWRLWRSIPTAMGNSCGRTETNKEERAWYIYLWKKIIGFSQFPKVISHEHFIFSIAWGKGRVTLFTCCCHIIRCLRRQVVECFSGELSNHTANTCKKQNIALCLKVDFIYPHIQWHSWGQSNTRTYPSQWLIFMATKWSIMALVYSGKLAT